MKGVYPEGEFSISTTTPLLPVRGSAEELEGAWSIPLERIEEILARKLLLRMYQNGDFVVRDIYDFFTAADMAPQALMTAISILKSHQRQEIANEIVHFRGRVATLGRPLLDVHRPEWLPHLAERVALLISDGPKQVKRLEPDSNPSPEYWAMPPFDVRAVRDEYHRLIRTGRVRVDRMPTREDIHARWHWQTEQRFLEGGHDPGTYCGRNSILISGRGRPEIHKFAPPIEHRFRYDPMPMSWFDHPGARHVFRSPDPEHGLLGLLCGKHLAGWQDRPTGAEMYQYLTEGTDNEDDRLMVRELLGDIDHEMYPRLRRQDVISAWHLARAAHECEVKRGRLSWWLNQFAVPQEVSDSPEFQTSERLSTGAQN